MNEPLDDLSSLPDPLRSWDIPSIIGILLNAVIPSITLIWTITSGYWFWSETLGNQWFGIGSVILEAIGLVGLGLYISGWDDRNLWVKWRWVLPYVPIPSLSYAIHSMVERNAAWVSTLTHTIGWNYQVIAWTFSIACVAALTFLSHVGWKTLEGELNDMFGAQEKRILRWKERQLRSLQAELTAARSMADVISTRLNIEVERLQKELPRLQAEALQMQQRAASAAIQLEALRQAAIDMEAKHVRETDEEELTIEAVKAALLIASGKSQNWTARVCGISRRKLRDWFNGDPNGWAQNVLNAAPKEMVQDALKSLDASMLPNIQDILALEEQSVSSNGAHP